MKLTSVVLLIAAMVSPMAASGAPARKVIDDGGSGPCKAEAVTEASLPGFTVYKPQDVPKAVATVGKLPVLVFANGGCNDTSLPHERMLNEIASHGYLVIALGAMQDSINDRQLGKSPNEDMIHAINWAETQNAKRGSGYEGCIDTGAIALGGQSCGGAQSLVNCGDKRVKTVMMFNSGMGDIEMFGASSASLADLHCPIIYIIGGRTDIAYGNAVKDYSRINHVPVVFADQMCVGHGGTFHEANGGSYSPLAVTWLDWQLKGKNEAGEALFLNNEGIENYPDWTIKAKNFAVDNEPFRAYQLHAVTREGKDMWGRLYKPSTPEPKKPLVVLAHGFNGNYLETQAYAESLAMNGIASYIFDFSGGSNYSHSEGETTDMTIYTEKDNVEDVYALLSTIDWVDTDRMALLGCSQGGLVSALTTALNPEMFQALVLIYPALTIPATAPMMLERFEANGNAPLEVMGMKLDRNYYDAINGLDIFELAPAFGGNTLIVYGDRDPIASGHTIDRAMEAYPGCTVKCISGGTHGFPDYTHHSQATKAVVDFIKNVFAVK